MNKTNKILLILFSAFFIVFIIELVYYFSFAKQKQKTDINTSASPVQETPYKPANSENNTCSNIYAPIPNVNPYSINPKYMRLLQDFKASSTNTVKLIWEQSGKMKDLSLGGTYKDKFSYILAFNIENENNDIANRLFFTLENKPKIILKGASDRELKISELKEGDKVTVRSQDNPLLDPTDKQSVEMIEIFIYR